MQTVYKGYEPLTKAATSRKRVKSRFSLAFSYKAIFFLDVYIEALSYQTPVSKIQKDRQKLRKSTAENVKHMYQQYCYRKWTKIEGIMVELIDTAAVAGIAGVSRPDLHITRNNFNAADDRGDSDWSGNIFSECDRGN